MRRLPRALTLLLWLSGCATEVSSTCSPIKEWTGDEQIRAQGELAPIPADDPLQLMFGDYLSMRDQARACLRAAK